MSETNELYDAVRVLARQAGGPNLPALSYALRHPDTWPHGFVWDYGDCRTCAMGLAARLWNASLPDDLGSYLRWISKETSMPYGEACGIFRNLANVWNLAASRKPYSPITPDDVADAIDRYLAAVE